MKGSYVNTLFGLGYLCGSDAGGGEVLAAAVSGAILLECSFGTFLAHYLYAPTVTTHVWASFSAWYVSRYFTSTRLRSYTGLPYELAAWSVGGTLTSCDGLEAEREASHEYCCHQNSVGGQVEVPWDVVPESISSEVDAI